MDSSMVGGLIAVGAVVVVALAARAMSKKAPTDGTPAPAPPPSVGWSDGSNVATGLLEPDARDDDEDDDEDEPQEHVIAVTTLGEALIPHHHAVRLVPPEEQGESWKVGAGIKSSNLRGEQALSMSWHSGDFTGVRVVQGDGIEGAWRVEALGRDGEYTTFDFETREGAEAARKLFEQVGIVQLGEDEDGNPAPPSAEQFEEARRIYKETEAALELPEDEEPR